MGLICLKLFMNLNMNHKIICGNDARQLCGHLPCYLSSPPEGPTVGAGTEVPSKGAIWE